MHKTFRSVKHNISNILNLNTFFIHVKCFCFIFSLSVSNEVMAINNLLESANTILTGTTFLTKFFWAACIFTGIYLLTAGLVNYKEHRNNPKMIPLSTVIVYVILGLSVIGVPFLSKLFGSDAYDFAINN